MIMSLLGAVGDFSAASGAMWSMTLRDQQTLDDVSRSDHLHVKKPKIEHKAAILPCEAATATAIQKLLAYVPFL